MNQIFDLTLYKVLIVKIGASSVGLICPVYHPRKTVPISTTLNSHKIFRPFLFCFPFLYAFIIAPLQKFVNTFFHFLNVFVEILFRCVLKSVSFLLLTTVYHESSYLSILFLYFSIFLFKHTMFLLCVLCVLLAMHAMFVLCTMCLLHVLLAHFLLCVLCAM